MRPADMDHLEYIRLLLDKGAKTDVQDRWGYAKDIRPNINCDIIQQYRSGTAFQVPRVRRARPASSSLRRVSLSSVSGISKSPSRSLTEGKT